MTEIIHHAECVMGHISGGGPPECRCVALAALPSTLSPTDGAITLMAKAQNTLTALAKNLRKHREEILNDWTKAELELVGLKNADIDTATLRHQSAGVLEGFLSLVESGEIDDLDGPFFRLVPEEIAEIARWQVKAQVPLRTMGQSLYSLKGVLKRHQKSNGKYNVDVLFPVIDNLVSAAFEYYLDARESFISAVVETAADGIVTINSKGIVQSFNRAAEGMFGYGSAEVIGQNVSMLMPKPYCDEHDDYVANYLHTGEAKILGSKRAVHGRRKDGSVFPMELGVREVRSVGEHTFSGVVRDLTELKEAQEALVRQTKDIMEFSTPVITVWKDVLALPLIGTLDTVRTEKITEKTLTRMGREKARVLIIDITGVPVVDTMVANHLIRMASSIRLMGGHCILTGISPSTAITIVGLGVDLTKLSTRSNLAKGLELAMEIVGVSGKPPKSEERA